MLHYSTTESLLTVTPYGTSALDILDANVSITVANNITTARQAMEQLIKFCVQEMISLPPTPTLAKDNIRLNDDDICVVLGNTNDTNTKTHYKRGDFTIVRSVC